MRDGDRLVAACLSREGDHLLLAHDGGLVTRFAAEEAREMGRSATGVVGMAVPAGAEVVALSAAPAGDGAEVLTVGTDGRGKRTPLAEYPVKGRGGKGLQTGADQLAWCGVATDLHVPTDPPLVLRAVDLAEARRAGRGLALDGGVSGRVVAEQDAEVAPGT